MSSVAMPHNPIQRVGSIVEHGAYSRAIIPGSTRVTMTPSTSSMHTIPMSTTRTNKRPTDKKAENQTNESGKLHIKWSTDWNIIDTHEKVIAYLKTMKETRNQLQLKLKICGEPNPNITTVEEISELRVKISSIKGKLAKLEGISIVDYSNEVFDLINEYKELSIIKSRLLGEKEKVNLQAMDRKIFIIETYFEIAQRYCPMDVIRDIKLNSLCSKCNGSMLDKGEVYVCSDCGLVGKKMELDTEKNDDTNGQPKMKSTATTEIALDDIVNQFDGSFKINIPEKIIKTITDYLAMYPKLKIANLSKTDLAAVMKQAGISIWTKHMSKIHNIITGKPCPDISQFKANIHRRASLIASIFHLIKPTDRKNFIHGIHFIWLSLMNDGYKPVMDDFFALKSRDVEHNNLIILKKGFDLMKTMAPDLTWNIYELP